MAAEALARRILADICEPVETDRGLVRVGASIGVVIIEPFSRVVSIDRLHAQADHEMYVAKKAGGGVRMYAPNVSQPFPMAPPPP